MSVIIWGTAVLFALCALVISMFVWDTKIKPWLVVTVRHRRTRDTPPAAGQWWVQGDTVLKIDRIVPGGIVIQTVMRTSWPGRAISWIDSPDEWRSRVRVRRLYMIEESGR
jgi:hypothetical protein